MQQQDQVLSIIRNISKYDVKLSSRSVNKIKAAEQSSNAQEFKTLMLQSKENGDEFACGLTRSYLTEAFFGLEHHYSLNKSKDQREGITKITAEELIPTFQKHEESQTRVIYVLKHMGTQDHDWVVEQIPGKGYRIYQSYHDAFSLKAWLSESVEELFGQGQIVVPNQLCEKINQSLNPMSLDNYQQFLDKIPPEMIPYLDFVKEFNQQVAENFFTRAWDKYGKGQILSKEVFYDYLEKNKKLIQYFYENDATTNIFSKEIYDLWAQIYGSPDPIYFPGAPNNFLSSKIIPEGQYYFLIGAEVLPGDDAKQQEELENNSKILLDSVENK